MSEPVTVPAPTKQITILVATPCYGGLVYQGYMHSVLQLQRLCDRAGINLIVKTHGNESLIPRGRNLYVAMTLAHPEITHLLYIDADITFQPESILRMVQGDKDICGLLYPKKGINFTRIRDICKEMPEVEPDRLEHMSYDYVFNVDRVNNVQITNGFMKVKYIGTGCMMIKRDVLVRMRDAYPETKYNNDIEGYNTPELRDNFYAIFDCVIEKKSKRYLSEDYLFCQRALDIGYEIWVDVTGPLTHTGTYDYKGHFLSQITLNDGAKGPAPARAPTPAPLPVPVEAPAPAPTSVVEAPTPARRVKFIQTI